MGVNRLVIKYVFLNGYSSNESTWQSSKQMQRDTNYANENESKNPVLNGRPGLMNNTES